MERGVRIMNCVQVFLLYIISAVKKVQFVSDRMSYIILRGRWCDIILLNVHALTDDKTDDMKNSFCAELENVFARFPKCHTEILLGDLSANVGRKDISKPTTGNESLHEISNDNGVRVVNFAASKSKGQKYNVLTS
jgi:hypothetical protein